VEVPLLVVPDAKKSETRRLPAAGASPQLILQEILEAFHGHIPPVRTTIGYRAGILILSVAMLVLPALYLALIAAVGYALFYHATANLAGINKLRNWWALFFLYIGPLVIGVILFFFLIKPLFARRSRRRKLRTLEFGEEPLLFALVTRVAQALGAPEPRRIDVDCQVNASASFGSLLGVLFGGDLVLTIGLPLVAGLSIQQLAGVVAHELGHFAQGTGLRVSFVVRSVNAWFSRLACERDDWDEALERGCAEGGQLAILLFLALLCVWLTRCVLWLLMAVGHALSCFMLRQMEYDADRYEARLAGEDAFAETMRRLLLLDLVTNAASGIANASWNKSGQLPDDLSTLIVTLAGGISPQDLRKIEAEMGKIKTGFFNTHPALGDRLASVRRENAPGVFHMDGPATQLFKDFPKMSRAVSFDFYREVLGKRVKRDALVPVAVLLGGEQGRGTE
jgi:Zn-dependent protease with chaperone function